MVRGFRSPRLLAVSDIHGLSDALLELLDYARYRPGRDRLHVLGDFIDGDAAGAALDTVRALVEGGAMAIRGNQEVEWMRKRRSADRRSERFAFLYSLPYYLLAAPYLFVHAGIRPGISLANQKKKDLVFIRDEFHDHSFVPDYTVVFGHTPTFRLGAPGEIYTASRKIGIDTGAKHGYRMTLVDLTNSRVHSCSTPPSGGCRDFRTIRHRELAAMRTEARRR
jgi:Calcineurin-like phosphoesterase